jgi:hypothetical protein
MCWYAALGIFASLLLLLLLLLLPPIHTASITYSRYSRLWPMV